MACPRVTGAKGVRCSLSAYGFTVKLPLAQGLAAAVGMGRQQRCPDLRRLIA